MRAPQARTQQAPGAWRHVTASSQAPDPKEAFRISMRPEHMQHTMQIKQFIPPCFYYSHFSIDICGNISIWTPYMTHALYILLIHIIRRIGANAHHANGAKMMRIIAN
jgi:hypothetical protein